MGFPIQPNEPLREGPAWPRWIAVAGGLGYLPLAPGTAGSLLGVLVFVGIAWSVSFALPPDASGYALEGLVFTGILGAVIGSGLVVGAWAATRAEADFGRKDDGRIVIDEVVGQLIALAPLPFLVGFAELPTIPSSPFPPFGPDVSTPPPDQFRFFGWVVTGFVLFRLFDVWKPGAVGWAERRFTGGYGVMMDDVVAGLHGALALAALHFAFCGVFGCTADVSDTAAGLTALTPLTPRISR